ncbi:MAG TPA: biopolymer transporter ExbD [Candidatus Polarisedimenticolia bacterium]|nr:biopolymer transporter ExbD [Candidatus Polarisedimenticolia bacterium]
MSMQLGSSGVKSDINVTPFVDICLVLLIIFMVVTPLLSRALDVAVPPKSDAEQAEPAPGMEQLILTVKGPSTSPRIFLNQEEIPGGPEAVKERISELMKGRREKVVFFQADNDLSYNYVVQIMDMIRGGGADKIGLITDENLDVSSPGAGL